MRAAPQPARASNRTIALVVVVALVLVFASRTLFGHHANHFETIAADVTTALQKNDVAGVKKYQNVETATQVTASRVGRGADTLAPLGSLKQTHETAADATTRVHQFDLTFEHGTLHETIKFDPDEKIVGFHYDEPQLTK
jgi:hypothetical protein